MGVSFDLEVSRRIARGDDAAPDGRIFPPRKSPRKSWRSRAAPEVCGSRVVGAGGRCRRCRESMGAGSSARDALREEPPRHGLQDFPRVTRSLARGQKRSARRQREKRSGEPRHSLACAPRGSASAPHDASRRFWCVRVTTRVPPLPCARVCRLARPARGSRNRERTNNDAKFPIDHESEKRVLESVDTVRRSRFPVKRSRFARGSFFLAAYRYK